MIRAPSTCNMHLARSITHKHKHIHIHVCIKYIYVTKLCNGQQVQNRRERSETYIHVYMHTCMQRGLGHSLCCLSMAFYASNKCCMYLYVCIHVCMHVCVHVYTQSLATIKHYMPTHRSVTSRVTAPWPIHHLPSRSRSRYIIFTQVTVTVTVTGNVL
jgi:hypothetical protein